MGLPGSESIGRVDRGLGVEEISLALVVFCHLTSQRERLKKEKGEKRKEQKRDKSGKLRYVSFCGRGIGFFLLFICVNGVKNKTKN